MPSLKEILILILVLFGSLVIVLANPNQSTNQQLEEENPTAQYNLNNNRINVIKQIENIPQQEITANPLIAPPHQEQKPQSETIETTLQTTPKTTLSLETVLAEIENLSSELKLEFENIQKQKQDCPSCSQSEESLGICATILAQLGGGACNCGTLHCTPPHGPWCVHPCCCVCCAACCR